MPGARPVAVDPGENARPRRSAGGSDVKVREADALVVEPVQVGRLQPGVAVGAQIAVALVVGDDQDDVQWLSRRVFPGCLAIVITRPAKTTQQEGGQKEVSAYHGLNIVRPAARKLERNILVGIHLRGDRLGAVGLAGLDGGIGQEVEVRIVQVAEAGEIALEG